MQHRLQGCLPDLRGDGRGQLLVAFGVTQLITLLAGITMSITLTYVILAIAVSSIIGILAGLYPAFQAAKLDPIVALTKN